MVQKKDRDSQVITNNISAQSGARANAAGTSYQPILTTNPYKFFIFIIEPSFAIILLLKDKAFKLSV
ncbi:MAG: hypothetical protein WA323_20950 [Candidatus Nitrosopolaris sp.]|jgi:hypothetical protein